jgi:hypothetical protein
MNVKNIFLSETGTLIYRGVDIEMTPNQIHDIKINLGVSTQYILDYSYRYIIEKRRLDNLEILLEESM